MATARERFDEPHIISTRDQQINRFIGRVFAWQMSEDYSSLLARVQGETCVYNKLKPIMDAMYMTGICLIQYNTHRRDHLSSMMKHSMQIK